MRDRDDMQVIRVRKEQDLLRSAERPATPGRLRAASIGRGLCLVVGLLGFAAGLSIARHHPLAPWAASIAFTTWAVVAALRPGWSYFGVPALLPIMGFAPWTGWTLSEESDLLILGAIAGGYAALAFGPRRRSLPDGNRAFTAARLFPAIAFATSLALGLALGSADAVREPFTWFAGYYDALNAVRIAKAFVFAALIACLLAPGLGTPSGDVSWRRMTTGLAVGACVAAAVVAWERLAFTGLLDFSSDYRATGPFWEMHLGGAALDGYLALTFPFVVQSWVTSRSASRFALWSAALILVTYACLVTFSRGLYMALPASMAVLGLLLAARFATPRLRVEWMKRGAVIAAFLALCAMTAWLAFRHGGYRALAAFVSIVGMALVISRPIHQHPLSALAIAATGGALACALALQAALRVPQGPYYLFGLVLGVTAATALLARRSPALAKRLFAPAAFGALLASSIGVALYWGGAPAAVDTAIAALAIATAAAWYLRRPDAAWLEQPKARPVVFAAVLGVCSLVATFTAGSYMEGRVGAAQSDLDLRIVHWTRVVGLLRTPKDWLLGQGLGRFPSAYFYGVDDPDFPGGHRLAEADGNAWLVVSGPRSLVGYGPLYRVSQRISGGSGTHYTASFDVRAPAGADLGVEVCDKHLLYSENCAQRIVKLEAGVSSWRHIETTLQGDRVAGGRWYAPREATFSISVASEGTRVDIDAIHVRTEHSGELIANGDFSDGLSRWFFTSDRYHLPWHAKNLALDILFEQGIVGIIVFAVLFGAALARLARACSAHLEAAYVVAALIGFVVVGFFDSLLDAPRLAFLFYLLLLVGLVFPAEPGPPNSPTTSAGRDVTRHRSV